jgi:hypothetical protein
MYSAILNTNQFFHPEGNFLVPFFYGNSIELSAEYMGLLMLYTGMVIGDNSTSTDD